MKNVMIKEIVLNGKSFKYELEYKKVKNINLRIRNDGTIYVSANRRVSQKHIEDFLVLKTAFIINALDKLGSTQKLKKEPYFTEEEIPRIIYNMCERVYPYFKRKGIEFPQIKFRKMVSRWGSCHPTKGILTFNINLMYAPVECIEYVVMHEFTHFLQANHSDRFYAELEKICPQWRECRQALREIYIRD